MTVAFNILSALGALYLLADIRRWYLRGSRGEYHCSECGHVSALPKNGP